jgi:hypothetical protein
MAQDESKPKHSLPDCRASMGLIGKNLLNGIGFAGGRTLSDADSSGNYR